MEAKQPCSPHGWTLDTLEKHLSAQLENLRAMVVGQDDRNKERFGAAEKAVNAALAAADKALAKAEASSEKRFEGLNELRAMAADQTASLRAMAADQAALYLPRAEYSAQHQAMQEKVDNALARIAKNESSMQGKQEGFGTIGSLILGSVLTLTALVSLATFVLNLLKH